MQRSKRGQRSVAASEYGTGWDVPGVQGTSRLSPTSTSARSVRSGSGTSSAGGFREAPADVGIFRSELGWREFCWHLLYSNPELATRNFRPEFDRFEWQALTGEELSTWQQGRTGSGADASPYSRIFNPVTQSKTFAADGRYLREFVPELAALDGKAIHEPWKQSDGAGLPAAGGAPRSAGPSPGDLPEAQGRLRGATRRQRATQGDPGGQRLTFPISEAMGRRKMGRARNQAATMTATEATNTQNPNQPASSLTPYM